MQELDVETRKALNTLAREKFKLKLYEEILFDIEVCKLENWEYDGFLKELKEMINFFQTSR